MTGLWQATEDFLDGHNLPPPYWAFAWVGGQAMARHILDHPEIVRGKRVLDFAAGCGLVAIAAAFGGATTSQAAEIDAMAVAAIRLNADVNGVRVDPIIADLLEQEECPWDVVMAGDVCYEQIMANHVFAWLRRCAASGALVLLADPGRNYLPRTGLMKLSSTTIACSVELEDRTSREAVVYRIVG
jgi:predicted nicotinamide N-methyase